MALAILLPAGALPARADEWSLSSATGPVFTLDDGAWVEIIEGEVVDVGVPLRTLRRAKAELSSGDIEITLGAESAVRIDSEGGTATVISQFSGTVTVEVHRKRTLPIILRTQTTTVTVSARKARFTSDAVRGTVSVSEGEATVVDAATGTAAEVVEGTAVSTTDLATSASVVTPVSSSQAEPNDGDNGNGNAVGGGTANGADGNGSGNNNESGNGNGGNGSAGGNNGNSNGNGNSGGNGNGNNGNGNGNSGNGNGNGNGNGKSKK